ncbi:MAG TPA: hypothetical protein VJX94_17305, partial [Stellaceae bacterium]|nr:hypothetical protein [Stellaceae bacterium]
MRDPLPAITESEATGVTTEIFADIRRVYKVGVVNLIWRHLATIPGGLPWVWSTIRPLYADGTVGREAAALRAGLSLPKLPAWPTAVFRSAGLEDGDIAGIRTVLAAYDRTNAMALIAFLAVQLRLEGVPCSVEVVARRPASAPAKSEPDLPLPPLLALADMPPTTAELVLAINGLGAIHREPLLASMYRHLAHWPAYLALAWTMLAPLEIDQRLDRAIEAAIAKARARARCLAGQLSTPLPAIRLVTARRVTRAIDRFTGDVIARMVVI